MASGRIRAPGAGRKRLTQTDPELAAALDALVDPDSRADPMSPLRWTCKSTGQLALALTRGGHPVSPGTMGTLLRESGYSLQANAKTIEGTQQPDRDAQFRYLNEKAREFRDAGPQRPTWRSLCATFRRGQASGTRSSTDCSRTSA